MKQMIILSSICIALGLTACQKQPNPETGASTEQHLDKAAEQAKNDFKQTVDTVSAKTKQASDHAASELDHTINQTEAQIHRATRDHQ